MLLEVRRPKVVTVGRTQSYRVVLRVVPEGQEDPAVLLCSREGPIRHFERVIEPWELRSVTTNADSPVYRASQVDLIVAAKGLADAIIGALQGDLSEYKKSAALPGGKISLSGATV
jgi:hypothetical protein